MQITKLVLENFSSYKDRNIFDFTVEDEKPIILIGGQNGAGKTSIFTAIKIALYGPLAFGYTGANSYYSRKIKGFINDNAFQEKEFKSGVSIEIKFIKERDVYCCTIDRRWFIHESKIVEKYNVYENGILLDEPGKVLFENYIQSIIPVELFEFFLFDGEETGNIFSTDSYNKYVKKALLTMCGIDDFEILHNFCKNYIGRISGEEERAISDKYALHQAKLSSVEKKLLDCNERISNNMKKISEYKAVIEQKNSEFIRLGGISPQDVKKLENEALLLDKEKENISRKIKNFFENIMPFVLMKDMIPSLEKQINYEEKAEIYEYVNNMISREYLSAVIVNSEIVKNEADSEKLADKLYDAVDKRFKISNGVYNGIIFDLSNSDRGKVLNLAEMVSDFKTEAFTNAIMKREELTGKIASIRQKLRNALTEEDSKKFTKAIAGAEDEIERLTEENRRLESKAFDLQDEFNNLTRVTESLRKKMLENTQNRHVLELSNSISQIMGRIVNESLGNIRHELEKKIVENLGKIYRKENLISVVNISENFKFELYQNRRYSVSDLRSLLYNVGIKEFCQTIGDESCRRLCEYFGLNDENGLEMAIDFCAENKEFDLHKRVELNMLSKGERQIFILAFYWAIIQVSQRQIPFVIDTPYARIDANHREEISLKFFPNISSQVIILSTDEEITKEYYNIIKPFISHEYLLINDQSENKTTVTEGYFFKEEIL